ncbi:hypothetical protein [Leptospira levettii]|uniref:hypothetical protein n=1 Tax=Leptospira levettii TaxID=2023178 RepID=UPI000C2A0375|nr:hypothetical protein [Leptospira levettii]PJZ87612.1 hypothetical protein CH368_16005 [Leptospira levettii]
METHTLELRLKTRSESQKETTILDTIATLPCKFLRSIPTEIRSSDNVVNIGLEPSLPVKYLIITGKHIEANASSVPPVQKGDPAPFKIRLNGSTDEIPAGHGRFECSGPLTDLKVLTDNELPIRLDILIGY